MCGKSQKYRLAAVLAILVMAACSRSPEAYVERGNKLATQGKYTDAALNYRKALQRDPRFGEAYYQLATVNLRTGKIPEAYQELLRATELLPARDDVKLTLADLALTAFLADRRRPTRLYEQINNLADQLQKKNPRSADAFRLKAYLALTESRLNDAKDLFRRANEVKPMQPQVIMGWTQALFQDKQDAEGEKLAYQLIDRAKDFKAIYDVLYAHYRVLDQPGEAEKVLKLKIANNPTDAGSVLQLAAYYAGRSMPDQMKAALDRMTANTHDFPQGLLYAGDFYAGRQRWDDALAEFQQGAKANPKEKIVYQKRIAQLWLAQGKGEQAGQVVDEILKQDPGDEAAKGAKASLLLAAGTPEKVQQAATQFQVLVDKSPDNAVWHFNLGRAFAVKRDFAGARTQFQEAIKKRNDFLPPRLALARLAQTTGDTATMLRYSNEILAINPQIADAKMLRAIALMRTDPAKASAELAALEQAYPQNEELQLQMAAGDLQQKKFREAEERLRKLVQAKPGDIRPLTALVQSYAAQKELDRAVPILEGQLKQSDSDAVRLLLAETREGLKDYDLAIDQYQRLIAKNPKSAPLAVALGRAYQLKGDLPNAILSLQKAVELLPQDARAASFLGDAQALAGRQQEAMATYRRALQIQPDNVQVMNNLAFVIADSGGSLDEALKLVQKAMEKAPKQPNFEDTLGWIYLKKSLNDSAVHVFQGLTQTYGQNPTFHYHLALALLQKGDRATAKAELNTALAQKPSGKIREDIQAALAKLG
ncbi:MAG: hypothetical protein C5B51_15665 [Terriglobia bacterium]|nr:MAG: hypothetical protein C5B51_15665 [Terriglobia bacterium]